MSATSSPDDPEAIRAEMRTLRIRILELQYERDRLLAADPRSPGAARLARTLSILAIVVFCLVVVALVVAGGLWTLAGMYIRG